MAMVALDPLISLQVDPVSQPDMSTLITSPMVPAIIQLFVTDTLYWNEIFFLSFNVSMETTNFELIKIKKICEKFPKT